MHKYHKTALFALLTATLVSGCSFARPEKTIPVVQTDIMQTKKSSFSQPHMVFLNGMLYQDAGRTVFTRPDHTDGTIQSVTGSDQTPANNGEANFDCAGASYCILADGAVGVTTDEASGTCELFLTDNTVEFQGVYKKKKELSSETLKWLNFYYGLSETDRNAISMIPSEFAGLVSGSSQIFSETSDSGTSYLEALTQEELDATEQLAQYYFTEEVTDFEGVDQIYPADSSDPQYHNSGIEEDYAPGNIIIYRVLTNLDRRDGNPFRYISIARKSKSDDWKIINSGF